MWFYFLWNYKPWKHQQNQMKGTFAMLTFQLPRASFYVLNCINFFLPWMSYIFNYSCCYSAHNSVFLETKKMKLMILSRRNWTIFWHITKDKAFSCHSTQTLSINSVFLESKKIKLMILFRRNWTIFWHITKDKAFSCHSTQTLSINTGFSKGGR